MRNSHQTSYPRSLRVAEEIQKILGDVFLTRVTVRGSGLLTVTRVELSRDLRTAHIHLSFLNPAQEPETLLREIIRRRKEIRYHMGNELRAKYVPELRFHVDHTLEHAARINALLDGLHTPEGEEDA